MFCAALSAPVTMWTLASNRTPDMPMGSRMPSWPSTMNSCGSTCRIFWSAGMATALAASMTCSTSLCVTSLSRIATTPWELRLRTWLPAIPANTEWISQPAISSASSTARWIDCTVDSMLTTTPFFRPREGCDPMPSTSIEPSAPTSPTSATTFEVPMSRPTIRLRSDRLSIPATALFSTVWGASAPADRKSIRVAHVHIRDIVSALSHQLCRRIEELVEALVDLPAPEPYGDPIREVEFPGTARIEPQGGHAQSGLDQAPLSCEVALRHDQLFALGTRELGELERHMTLIVREQLATRIQQSGRSPARHGHLLHDEHAQATRPRALHAHGVYPGNRVNRPAHCIDIHTQKTFSPHLLLDDPLHIARCDTLEAPGDGHRFDGLIQGPEHEARQNQKRRERAERCDPGAPVNGRQLPAALPLLTTILLATEHA